MTKRSHLQKLIDEITRRLQRASIAWLRSQNNVGRRTGDSGQRGKHVIDFTHVAMNTGSHVKIGGLVAALLLCTLITQGVYQYLF